MTIIFDLDHTLFRTNLFKKDLFDIFYNMKIEKNVVNQTYNEHCKKESGGAYDFKKHCSKIEKEIDCFDKTAALVGFSEFVELTDFSKYIERNCIRFLKKQKKLGNKLILLTKGGEEIQRIKFEKTGLAEFFDEFLICKNNKFQELNKMKLGRGDYFVNDLFSEIIETMELFPKVTFVMLDLNRKKLPGDKISFLGGVEAINSIDLLKI